MTGCGGRGRRPHAAPTPPGAAEQKGCFAMALCSDKSLTYLNDLGYNVVRLPRGGIEPLDVLGRDGRSIERLERLDQLWTSTRPVPETGAPQLASHVNGQTTSDMKLSVGLRLLSGVLGAIGAKAPELASAHSRADTLQFAFGDVVSRSVPPLEVGDFLSAGDLHAANPVVERYFGDDDTEGFVITEVLQSAEINVSAKDERGREIKADVPAIKAMVGADVSVAAKDAAGAQVIYRGASRVTFGFKAFAIAFDGRWRITGAEPSAELAFSTGREPVVLRRGTLALRSA